MGLLGRGKPLGERYSRKKKGGRGRQEERGFTVLWSCLV